MCVQLGHVQLGLLLISIEKMSKYIVIFIYLTKSVCNLYSN